MTTERPAFPGSAIALALALEGTPGADVSIAKRSALELYGKLKLAVRIGIAKRRGLEFTLRIELVSRATDVPGSAIASALALTGTAGAGIAVLTLSIAKRCALSCRLVLVGDVVLIAVGGCRKLRG